VDDRIETLCYVTMIDRSIDRWMIDDRGLIKIDRIDWSIGDRRLIGLMIDDRSINRLLGDRRLIGLMIDDQSNNRLVIDD
jgi:hypothetical protein